MSDCIIKKSDLTRVVKELTFKRNGNFQKLLLISKGGKLYFVRADRIDWSDKYNYYSTSIDWKGPEFSFETQLIDSLWCNNISAVFKKFLKDIKNENSDIEILFNEAILSFSCGGKSIDFDYVEYNKDQLFDETSDFCYSIDSDNLLYYCKNIFEISDTSYPVILDNRIEGNDRYCNDFRFIFTTGSVLQESTIEMNKRNKKNAVIQTIDFEVFKNLLTLIKNTCKNQYKVISVYQKDDKLYIKANNDIIATVFASFQKNKYNETLETIEKHSDARCKTRASMNYKVDKHSKKQIDRMLMNVTANNRIFNPIQRELAKTNFDITPYEINDTDFYQFIFQNTAIYFSSRELSHTPKYINPYTSFMTNCDFHENGRVKKGILTKDIEIQGIKYQGGVVIYFYENGQVKEGYLDKDTEIQGIKYKEDRPISFYASGKVESGILAKDTEIDGIKYQGGEWICFDESGRFKSGTLAKETEIQGIKYKEGQLICFYKNGKVEEGILAKETEIQGIKFKEGELIFFYENGKVEEGTLAEDTEINGIKYQEGEWICFYASGRFKKGILAKETEIEGIKYQGGEWICFDESGRFKSGTLTKDTEINGIEYQGGESICFDENGKVKEGILAKETEIDGIKYQEVKCISFDESGKVKYGTLAEDTEIQGIKYQEDVVICFDENGKVVKKL